MRCFLVDNQLSTELARWLVAKGDVADHVLALGLTQSTDADIWQRAALQDAVIISKDEDFAHMTLLKQELVAVIWLRMGNCRTATLLEAMERAWPSIIQQLDAGARLIEVY